MKGRILIREISDQDQGVAVSVRKEIAFSCESCSRFEFDGTGCRHWGKLTCPLLAAFTLLNALGLERLPRA